MTPRRAWMLNALTAAVATLLAVGIGEGAVRVFVPDTRPEFMGSAFMFYRFDEKLGWANAPLVSGTFKRREFEYTVRINRFGMRQKDVAVEKAPGVFRIAFLGDSFVWGVGVPDEQRLTELVGTLPGVEALNFGVSAYGPLQEYLLLDKVKTFSPDLVVLVFCLNNDFEDNVLYERYGYYKPYAVFNSTGELEIKGYPLRKVMRPRSWATWGQATLLDESRLVSLSLNALDALSNIFRRSEQAGLIGFSNEAMHSYPRTGRRQKRLADTAVLINKEILRRMKAELDQVSVPMVLVPAPTLFEYDPKGEYGGVGMNTTVSDILKTTASELGLDFLDTVPRLDGHDFWPKDGHWNAAGHKKMAQVVIEYLQRRGCVRPAPSR